MARYPKGSKRPEAGESDPTLEIKEFWAVGNGTIFYLPRIDGDGKQVKRLGRSETDPRINVEYKFSFQKNAEIDARGRRVGPVSSIFIIDQEIKRVVGIEPGEVTEDGESYESLRRRLVESIWKLKMDTPLLRIKTRDEFMQETRPEAFKHEKELAARTAREAELLKRIEELEGKAA